MVDKAYSRWLKAQKAAIANFKPTNTISKCPDCFGSLPQGNDSAWAKGCHECPLFTHSDACSKATDWVNDASMTKKEWLAMSIRYKKYMSEEAWQKQFGKGQPKI